MSSSLVIDGGKLCGRLLCRECQFNFSMQYSVRMRTSKLSTLINSPAADLIEKFVLRAPTTTHHCHSSLYCHHQVHCPGVNSRSPVTHSAHRHIHRRSTKTYRRRGLMDQLHQRIIRLVEDIHFAYQLQSIYISGKAHSRRSSRATMRHDRMP